MVCRLAIIWSMLRSGCSGLVPYRLLHTFHQNQGSTVCSPVKVTVDQTLGLAYHGLGQVIEFLAAEVKKVSAPSSQIPVELTALEVGPGVRGREMISFDVSQFGDPLDTRCARAPFSRYLKSVRQEAMLGGQQIVRGLIFAPIDS